MIQIPASKCKSFFIHSHCWFIRLNIPGDQSNIYFLIKIIVNGKLDLKCSISKNSCFKKLKLMVKKSGVHFMDMKVHFANGDVMDVELRNVIPKGGETRIIDLPGRNRIVKKVVFWYKSTKVNAKRATILLYGIR